MMPVQGDLHLEMTELRNKLKAAREEMVCPMSAGKCVGLQASLLSSHFRLKPTHGLQACYSTHTFRPPSQAISLKCAQAATSGDLDNH